MDIIDRALIDAWHRVHDSIRTNPISASSRRRLARQNSPTLRRPIRPWCLCLRASDTRIHDKHWQVSDEDRRNENPHPPHEVFLSADHIRDLTKPVDLDWPGVDWTEAARRLGRHPESLRAWLKRGVFSVSRRNARSVSKRGHPVPFIHSNAPIDPNHECGRPPDPIWSHLWQSLHTRLPHSFEQTFQRIPRFRFYKGHDAPRFRGYRFLCPTCKRPVDTLFYPLPVWTIADFLSTTGVPPVSSLPSPSLPISPSPSLPSSPATAATTSATSPSPPATAGTSSSPTSAPASSRAADVPRPSEADSSESQPNRKRPYKPHIRTKPIVIPTTTTTRRARTLDLLLQHHTYHQIAAILHTTYESARHDSRTIFKAHQVPTRKALINKLHSQKVISLLPEARAAAARLEPQIAQPSTP